MDYERKTGEPGPRGIYVILLEFPAGADWPLEAERVVEAGYVSREFPDCEVIETRYRPETGGRDLLVIRGLSEGPEKVLDFGERLRRAFDLERAGVAWREAVSESSRARFPGRGTK